MLKSFRVPLSDKTIRAIATAAYADYSGRKVFLCATETVHVENNFWSDGSREYYVFLRLSDRAVVTLPSANPLRNPGEFAARLPEGFVCVRRSYFQGTEAGLTILANPANVAALLGPAAVPLTAQPVVL